MRASSSQSISDSDADRFSFVADDSLLLFRTFVTFEPVEQLGTSLVKARDGVCAPLLQFF